jgi:hypothetical protein
MKTGEGPKIFSKCTRRMITHTFKVDYLKVAFSVYVPISVAPTWSIGHP